MSHVDDMIKALEQEVRAIRAKSAEARLELRNGRFAGRADGKWLYRFTLEEELFLRDDTPLVATINGQKVEGEVVALREATLIISLQKDFGETILQCSISTDNSFLIQRLKGRLEEARNGADWFNRNAADRAIGDKQIRVGTEKPHQGVSSINVLNEEQLSALRMSLGSDTTFIWGPPGTGKTTTLASIVEAQYREGRSVLLVSNTNIAVDTALEKVSECLSKEDAFHSGHVVRLGPVVKEELRERYGDYVIPDQIAERLAAPLIAEREKLSAALHPIVTEENELRAALGILDTLADTRQRLEQQEEQGHKARDEAIRHTTNAQRHRQEAVRLREKVIQARSMRGIRRILAGLDPIRLGQQAATAENRAEEADRSSADARQRASLADNEARTLRSEVAALSRTTTSYPSRGTIEARLNLLKAESARIRSRLSRIEQELSEIRTRILNDCKIMATTAYRSYLGTDTPRTFDVVVIDEASMLMPPLTYLASGLAKSFVIIAGDFRQLAPIIQASGDLADTWLKQDVFRIAGVADAVKRQDVPLSTPHVMPLVLQYRMTEDICQLVNDRYYGGKLKTASRDAPTQRGFPFGEDSLLYIDTGDLGAWASYQSNRRSRYNLLHAMLVQNIVQRLHESGYLPENEPNESIGVVSPFAAQARLIDGLLTERLGQRGAGIAATVHRFQGNEKATMILDLTDATGVSISGFLKAKRIDEEGARLLNVALSRAKDHVILVGDFRYLIDKGGRSSLVTGVIQDFRKYGSPIEIDLFSELTGAEWATGLGHLGAAAFDFSEDTSAIFDERTFYEVFPGDLKRAEESIIIFSPYMTEDGVGRWADYFRLARLRGISVQIHTQPPRTRRGFWDNPTESITQRLRQLGVSVAYRSNMHEKVALIDRHIAWHGSLNILSHNNSTESMFRIVSRSLCKNLGDNLDTETSSNPVCPQSGHETVRMARQRDGATFYKCIDPACGCTVDDRRHRGGRSSRRKSQGA